MERQRRGNGRIQEEIQAFNNQAQAADSLIGQRYGMVKMLHGKLSHIKNSYHRRTSLSSDKPPISLKGN